MTARLDLVLVRRGLARSRGQAADAIKAGRVLVNGQPAHKPSEPVSDADDVQFVTDAGVRRCGTLRLELVDLPPSSPLSAPEAASRRPRVIQTKMTFGGTEIRMSAVDVATGQCVRCAVDFLSQ